MTNHPRYPQNPHPGHGPGMPGQVGPRQPYDWRYATEQQRQAFRAPYDPYRGAPMQPDQGRYPRPEQPAAPQPQERKRTRTTGLAVGAVYHLAEMIANLPGLKIVGLMTMAPFTDDRAVIRRAFVRTRELFEEVRGIKALRPHFHHLSMGMSNDFPIAVEEGATIVRIGTALFEGLAKPVPQ